MSVNLFNDEAVNEIKPAPIYKKKIGYGVFKVVDFTMDPVETASGRKRIDIHLENEYEDVKVKYAIFTKPEVANANGKFQFVDKYNNTDAYWKVEAEEKMDSRPNRGHLYNFDAESARKAFIGEIELVNFCNASELVRATVKKGDTLEQVERAFSEDITTRLFQGEEAVIEAVKNKIIGKEVYCFVYLNSDKEYSTVSPWFCETWNNRAEGFFTKKIESDLKQPVQYRVLGEEAKYKVQVLGEYKDSELISSSNGTEDSEDNDMPF